MIQILFTLFATLALSTAAGVILSKNPIHSVIFLILVFCNTTALLLLFKIEFLAMMFIIIYVGAIAVLFLFVVMMLNIKVYNESYSKKNWIAGCVIASALCLDLCILLTYAIYNDPIEIPATLYPAFDISLEFAKQHLWLQTDLAGSAQHFPWVALIEAKTNTQNIGRIIYTYYIYHFLVASLILLIAMIGAIVLTMHKKKNAAKQQLIYQQLERHFQNTIHYYN